MLNVTVTFASCARALFCDSVLNVTVTFASCARALFCDSVLNVTVTLRQKRVISALVADHRTLPLMFDITTSLMLKLFTLSPQVFETFDVIAITKYFS